MKMKKFLTLIGVLIAFFLIVPFFLNLFIGLEHPQNVKVVGDEKLWIQFYGNYIGSTLAVIGAFYVCYLTIDENKKAQKSDFRHREILEIQRELANRFQAYTPNEIIPYSLMKDAPNEDNIKSEIDRLQKLNDKCAGLLVSAKLLYENTKFPAAKDFFESYDKMIQSSFSTILALAFLCKKQDKTKWENDISSIAIMANDSLTKNNESISKACVYLRKLRTDLGASWNDGIDIENILNQNAKSMKDSFIS